ncbi:MAG: hypothetical protein OZ928_04070 [Polyangiaceae bacterium]|nr:hypothetical protein [Polyangiaceae bacterium]
MTARQVGCAILVLWVAAGCAAARPSLGPPAPESVVVAEPAPEAQQAPSSTAKADGTAEPPLESLPEAEAALARASAELDGLYGASSSEVGARPSAAAPAAPADAAGAAAPAQAARAEGGSSCETTCRAFGSLRRAADAVCRLAGDDDSRCARGRKLVADNAQRVAACGCK